MTLSATVLIPAARVDDHLHEAVASAQKALGDEDEILIVLDGVQALVPPSGENIRIIELAEKCGTPHALNVGLQQARGDLIVRLDADDLMAPDRIARDRRWLESSDTTAAVCSPVIVVDEDSRPIGSYGPDGGPRSIRTALLRRNQVVHSSSTYRRDAALDIGGYDERCTRMQDYEFFMRLAARSDIVCLPEPLTSYRVHGNMSSSLTSPYTRYTWQVLMAKRGLAHSMGGPARVLWPAVAGAWWVGQVARHHGLIRARNRRNLETL